MEKADRKNPVRLHCPEHFQERITQVGGLNRYGEPNFKLAWAQTEVWESKHGGEWKTADDGSIGGFKGYRSVLKGDGNPHWMLMQWVDAGKSIDIQKAESPEEFYKNNLDPETGLQLLGRYPHQGSYQIVVPLIAKTFKNGELHIERFPLSTEIINMMIPVIKGCMKISISAKMQFMKDEKEAEDKEQYRIFEDAYLDSRRKPTLGSTPWLEDLERKREKICTATNAAFLLKMSKDKFRQSDTMLPTFYK